MAYIPIKQFLRCTIIYLTFFDNTSNQAVEFWYTVHTILTKDDLNPIADQIWLTQLVNMFIHC